MVKMQQSMLLLVPLFWIKLGIMPMLLLLLMEVPGMLPNGLHCRKTESPESPRPS